MKIIDEAGIKPRRVQLFRIVGRMQYMYGVRFVEPSGAPVEGSVQVFGTYAAAEEAFNRMSFESALYNRR